MPESLLNAYAAFEAVRLEVTIAENRLHAAERRRNEATGDYAYARRRLAMSVDCPTHDQPAGTDCSGKEPQASGMPTHTCNDRLSQALEQAQRRS